MKAFVVVLVGRVLQMILAFVALRAMSSLLGAEEIARLSIVNTVGAFFALILVNPAGMYINRRLHAWRDAGLLIPRLIRFTLFLGGVAAFAAVVIPLVQFALGHPWPIADAWLVLLVTGYLVINSLNQIVIPSLNILGHRMSWLIFSTLTLVAALGLSLLLAHRAATAEEWQLGQLAGYLLGFVVALPVFLKYVRRPEQAPLIEPDSLRAISAFTLPLAIVVALNWVQFQSYRLVLVRYINLELFGRFVAVYMLVAGLMAAFENLIQQYFYPQLYAKSSSALESDRAEAWRQFASVALPTTLIGGLTLLAAGRPLVRAILAPAFHNSYPVVLIAVIAETCRVGANIYVMAGQVAMKTRSFLIPQIVSALTLLILLPVCAHVFATQIEFFFLISLGTPALLLIGLSAYFARRTLSLSVSWREFGPTAIAFVLATGIFIANFYWVTNSMIFAAAEILIVGALFSGLMAWTVLRWRRRWLLAPGISS